MSWKIKGEAGRTLDATLRSLDSLHIETCQLKFQSLEADTLTWSAAAEDATGAGTIIPDYGQIVELWRDGERKFRGHCTAVRAGMRQIQITIEGPWWWMERTNLTEDQKDATDATAERHSYVFPTQSLATSIDSLMDRAITNGVPMTAGNVATMFNVPRMTLSEQTCANALATLMSWCPDSVAWFDYSGGAAPILNVSRRKTGLAVGSMPAITYTIAADSVEIGEITPRMDLEVARNELHYMVRNATTGKPAWAAQSSGADAAGKRQIVTVSGPEIVDFLPKDDFDSYALQTLSLNTVFTGGFQSLDPAIKTIFATYGYGRDPYYYAGVPIQRFWTGTEVREHLFPPYSCKDSKGVKLATESYHLILTANPPSWLTDQGIAVTLSQWFLMLELPSNTGYSPCFGAWRQGATDVGVAIINGMGSAPYNWAVREAKLSGWVLPNALGHTALTTVYKPWEYDFIAPPDGLAAALVDAQNWVPWEGPITLAGDVVSGDNLLPNKFNLANALPPCAIMGALAKGVSHDIMRGRTTIELGAPARVDFGTLVSRVRQDPKDNIVYVLPV